MFPDKSRRAGNCDRLHFNRRQIQQEATFQP